MTTDQKRCERSYQTYGGTFQVRTQSGRIVARGNTFESVERHATGERVLWCRYVDFWRVVWLAR